MKDSLRRLPLALCVMTAGLTVWGCNSSSGGGGAGGASSSASSSSTSRASGGMGGGASTSPSSTSVATTSLSTNMQNSSTSSNTSADGGADTATGLSVAPGATAGTAVVTFGSSTASGVTGYTVTAEPASGADAGADVGLTASAATSPITVTGLASKVNYVFSVVAHTAAGDSAPLSTGALGFFDVVATFDEPMTQPNNTVFTGSFTFDWTAKAVTNLAGSLTESMVGPPMTTVTLSHQLSSVPYTVPADAGTGEGLLVATFALATANVFAGGGFAPGGMDYYGWTAGDGGTPDNDNAYVLIFVNTASPTAGLVAAEVNQLAYADCTPSGLMMKSMCMTGTSAAVYGTAGTMDGYPLSEVITQR